MSDYHQLFIISKLRNVLFQLVSKARIGTMPLRCDMIKRNELAIDNFMFYIVSTVDKLVLTR